MKAIEFQPRVLAGRYVYRLDGSATSISETFTLAPTSVDTYDVYGQRNSGNGQQLTVKGRLEQGLLVAAHFVWEDDDGRREAWFDALGPAWRVRDQPAQVPPEGLVFGLLRVFTGPLLLAIQARGGRAGVLSPQLDASMGPLLVPTLSHRQAILQGGMIDYRGGPYADSAQCCVREDGLLDFYEWSQDRVGVWRVELDD